MDTSIHKQLPELLTLASDRSEQGKLILCEKLAEIFFTPTAALTDHEHVLVNELIEDIMKDGSTAIRQALITKFAQSVNVSRPVARRIASGPIDIARPVLVANENLADEDLIEIINTKGSRHASAIATRKQISEAVADALVTSGDLAVMQVVAENLGARISGRAIDILIDAGRLASLLQKPILARPELSPESAARLYWWVSKDMRRATLEKFGFGPGKLSSTLSKATDEILAALHLQKEDATAMRYLADWLEERNALTISLLLPLLRMEHYRLFNICLSRLSNLDLAYVDMINSSAGNGRMMVVLCRALGMDKGSFVSVFLMSRGARSDDQIVHPRELSQALEAFDKLHPDMAKALLESWRTDPSGIVKNVQRASISA